MTKEKSIMTKEQKKQLSEMKKEYSKYFLKGNGYSFEAKITEELYILITPDWDCGLNFSISGYQLIPKTKNKTIKFLLNILDEVNILNSITLDVEKLCHSLKESKNYGKMIKDFVKRTNALAKETKQDRYEFFEEHFLSMDN